MWSAIGLATARRVRVCGALTVNKFLRPTSRVPRLPTTTPAACPVSLSLVSRRGFADAKSPAPKKKTTARTKKATATTTTTKKKKKPAPKPKKVAAKKPKARALTPEEKQKIATRNDKVTALLSDEPVALPSTGHKVHVVEFFKAAKATNEGFTREVVRGTLGQASQSYQTLSESERERLQTIASQNVLANKAAHTLWVQSHSPAEIYAANLARRRLKKPLIKDDRLPTRPLNAYMFFIKSKTTAGALSVSDPISAVKLAAQTWNGMSEAERKPFVEAATADRERYVKEFQDAFGHPPPSSKSA